MLPFRLCPQFLLPGQKNRLSGVHDGPLPISWPPDANVQRTVSPTLMLTGSGAKLFWPFGPTVISTVCAAATSATLVRLRELPDREVNLSIESSSHTAGEPTSHRPSIQ